MISTYLGLHKWLFPREIRSDELEDEETHQLTSSEVVGTARSGRQILRNVFDSVHQKELELKARHRFFLFFVIFTIFFVFYAQIIASAILTDKMVTDRVGLLASKECGLYEYDNERWGEEEAARADILMVERERRAAAYAQECYDYGTNKKGKAMTCDFFYNSTIGFDIKEATCPFDKKEVCFDRSQPGSAVTFDTGFKDSSLLGINANPTHLFRRTSTCAALSSEPPYVEHFSNSATDHGYLYEYGSMYNTSDTKCESPPQATTDYTMRIVGHPFDWQAPVYRLNTWATSLAGDPKCDGYQPIPDLKAPGLTALQRTQILTIVFVTPLHIIYTKPSNDPIFRADTKFRYPGETRDYYKNGSPKSRAFACIDETLFCEASGTYCWHEHETIPKEAPDVKNDPAYWFMLYSLKKSNTYDSIKLRLGSSLIAQQRVGLARSQPLLDNHWQLEAEHMFKTSLARAQFDAWSLASGEDHDDATYMNTVPGKAGDMCGLFKFHARGFVNVQIWPFSLLCSILPLTLIFSVETKTYRQKANSAFLWMKNWVTRTSRSHHTTTTSPEAPTNNGSDENPFSVGSTPSTRRSLDTPSAPAAVADLQNSQQRNPDLTGQNSMITPTNSLATVPINAQRDNSPCFSIHDANLSRLTEPVIVDGASSETTPLNIAIAQGSIPRDYGTSNSARASQESSRVGRFASLTSIGHHEDANDSDANNAVYHRTEEWSPLLVHSIILIPVYIFQWLGKGSSG